MGGLVDGSKEIVFLRPRLVVPGTLGPADEDVYLMISVSEGNLKESSMDGLKSKAREGINEYMYAGNVGERDSASIIYLDRSDKEIRLTSQIPRETIFHSTFVSQHCHSVLETEPHHCHCQLYSYSCCLERASRNLEEPPEPPVQRKPRDLVRPLGCERDNPAPPAERPWSTKLHLPQAQK